MNIERFSQIPFSVTDYLSLEAHICFLFARLLMMMCWLCLEAINIAKGGLLKGHT